MKKDKRTLEKVKAVLNESVQSNKLLVIELQDEASVPKVFCKGEEVTSKVHVSFDWKTRGCRDSGKMSFLVKHLEEKGIENTFGKSRGDLT